jgi:hypothetical protein
LQLKSAKFFSLLLTQKYRIDSLEAKCGRLCALVVSQWMDNLSLVSNNQGTQSSNHGGGVEAQTLFQNQVPMEIEGASIQHYSEEQEDEGSMQI